MGLWKWLDDLIAPGVPARELEESARRVQRLREQARDRRSPRELPTGEREFFPQVAPYSSVPDDKLCPHVDNKGAYAQCDVTAFHARHERCSRCRDIADKKEQQRQEEFRQELIDQWNRGRIEGGALLGIAGGVAGAHWGQLAGELPHCPWNRDGTYNHDLAASTRVHHHDEVCSHCAWRRSVAADVRNAFEEIYALCSFTADEGRQELQQKLVTISNRAQLALHCAWWRSVAVQKPAEESVPLLMKRLAGAAARNYTHHDWPFGVLANNVATFGNVRVTVTVEKIEPTATDGDASPAGD